MHLVSQPPGLVAAFNAYNESADLGVPTSVDGSKANAPRRSQADHAGDVEDPELCRIGMLAAFDALG